MSREEEDEEGGKPYRAIIGSCWRSEELADRFSSKSNIALGLPRTTICWPRTLKWRMSPVNGIH